MSRLRTCFESMTIRFALGVTAFFFFFFLGHWLHLEASSATAIENEYGIHTEFKGIRVSLRG